MKSAKQLLNILELTEVGTHQFEGESKTIGSPNVFGGQVLAQALNAAYRTITNNRILHSLHSYFWRQGIWNCQSHMRLVLLGMGVVFLQEG